MAGRFLGSGRMGDFHSRECYALLKLTLKEDAMATITISAPTTGTSPVTIGVSESTTSLSDYLDSNRGLAVSIPYGGTGINLTSMGRFPDSNSVWRLRNGTSAVVSSTLFAYRGGFSAGYNLPVGTDTFVVSSVSNTHILSYPGGNKVKATNPKDFSYDYDISPENSSNTDYVLVGGGGNDTLTGTSKADILVGKGGDDTLNLGGDTVADTVSYHLGDGTDTINGFVKDGTGQDLLSFTGIANIDVVTSGSDTQLRLGNGGFGTGDLLATIVGVTGFTSADLGSAGDNLASTNTATFAFS
jgi:Ca2+-binding RTX toxin-like protein